MLAPVEAGASPKLIVIRGNSGSGKTSVAAAVRAAYGRGMAIVGQDNVRRQILREHDVPGGVNIGLIDTISRYSLSHGYHVLLEGILPAAHYAPMLHALRADHAADSVFFYLDVSLGETLRRHQTRPMRAEVTPDQLRGWYQHRDLLPGGYETVIPEHSTMDATVRRVLQALEATAP
jgi:Zeta toxin